MNTILKNYSTGKLITGEGMDTAGKSTQTNELANAIELSGKPVKVFHFPMYERPIGNLIGNILNGTAHVKSDISNRKIPLDAMQMLYVADQLAFQEELKELLTNGVNVILDRYDLSTIVYYSTKTSMDEALKTVYGQWQTRLLKPDLTFILNLPPEEVAKRKGNLDLFERDFEFMSKVSQGYKTLASLMTDRHILSIDGMTDRKTISDEIYRRVKALWEI